MTAKTDTWENQLLLLLLNNTSAANIGDATGLRGSTTAGSLYIAFWIGDPGEAASGGAEASYTGYTRVAVARSSAGFTVSGSSAVNAAAITGGQCTGGTLGTITHGAIMTASSGGTMLYKGALSNSIVLASGIIPEIAAGGLTLGED